jgi:hypothetical protein
MHIGMETLSGDLRGQLKQQPTGQWQMDLAGESLKLFSSLKESHRIDAVTLKGMLSQDFRVGNLSIMTQLGSGVARANIDVAPDRLRNVKIDLAIDTMPVRPALALWPQGLSRSVHHYLLGALREGVLERLQLVYQASWEDTLLTIRDGHTQKESDLQGVLSFRKRNCTPQRGWLLLKSWQPRLGFTGSQFEMGPAIAVLSLPDNRFLTFEEGKACCSGYPARSPDRCSHVSPERKR